MMITAFALSALMPLVPHAESMKGGEIAFMRGGSVCIVDIARDEERTLFDCGYDRPLAWSPDGEHLLFWKHSDVGWDIWRIDADGSGPTNLTYTKSGGCRSAAYSPDGAHIAFMRDHPQGVHVMDADGSNQRRLTTPRSHPTARSSSTKRRATATAKSACAMRTARTNGT